MTGDRFLNTKQAAKRLGVAPSTMAKWRVYGYGPSYAVLGVRGSIVYDPADLDLWVKSKKIVPLNASPN